MKPPSAALTSNADTDARIAQLEARIEASEAALRRIVEVNERLLIVAMETRADADTAAMALQEAQSSATLDALTGLPNRSTMSVQIVQAIAHARRRGGLVALLFLGPMRCQWRRSWPRRLPRRRRSADAASA